MYEIVKEKFPQFSDEDVYKIAIFALEREQQTLNTLWEKMEQVNKKYS